MQLILPRVSNTKEPHTLANVGTQGGFVFPIKAIQEGKKLSISKTETRAKMNNLSFDDSTLDSLDPTMSLHDPSEIDTALLSDIDGT